MGAHNQSRAASVSPADQPSVTAPCEVLTVGEVAKMLRISKAHVHNLIKGTVKGVSPLPVISLGRRRLVRRSTLDAWERKSERVLRGDKLSSSPEVDAGDA